MSLQSYPIIKIKYKNIYQNVCLIVRVGSLRGMFAFILIIKDILYFQHFTTLISK